MKPLLIEIDRVHFNAVLNVKLPSWKNIFYSMNLRAADYLGGLFEKLALCCCY